MLKENGVENEANSTLFFLFFFAQNKKRNQKKEPLPETGLIPIYLCKEGLFL